MSGDVGEYKGASHMHAHVCIHTHAHMCSGCASPVQDLGDPVSIAGHSGKQLQLLRFSGLTG